MTIYRFSVSTSHNNVGGVSEAFQGVAVSPSNFFTISSGTIFKYDRSWNLVTSRSVTADAPTSKSQINGIVYDSGTGKLYIGANNFSTTPKLGWIVEYDPSDLSWIATHSVEAHWAEGCAIRSGEFWVYYHDWPFVTRYDASWAKVNDYALAGIESLTLDLFNGGAWSGDDLYLVRHNNTNPTQYFVYRWNGSSFDWYEVRDTPASGSNRIGQGIAFEEGASKAYWAQRIGTAGGNVVETDLTVFSPATPGAGWTLLNQAHRAEATAADLEVSLDTTNADLIVVTVNSASATTVSVTDSKGNTVTAMTAVTTTANRKLVPFYIKPTSVGAGHKLTINNASFASVFVSAWARVNARDQESTADSATQAGSITPSQDGSLVMAYVCSRDVGTYTINSGFTIIEQLPFLSGFYDGGAQAYLIQTPAAAVNPAWSTTGSVGIVSFTPGAAPASAPKLHLVQSGLRW